MEMKQVLIRQGKAIVEDIPAPKVEPGTVLVRVDHSCISIGTEMSGLKSSGMPIWKRALKQPENFKKVLESVAAIGISKTKSLVAGRLSAGSPTGYSASGTVIEVGEGIYDLKPGDRVACAGAQCANHAEVIRVPRNLTVSVPGNLDFDVASTVTLGAIALQGVRRATPTLGETFVVLGLGILGQITAQLLKANGCRVIGVDLDRGRIRVAEELGSDIGIHPDDGNDIDQIHRLTDGIGADGVIITAATSSDAVISTAFKMCRKKGRVVLVGDVGLNLSRGDFYQKELDFFISTSYGPGRYDSNYEEKGLDYPVSYVRWTENRNLSEYLRLASEGRLRIKPLINASYPIDNAGEAYEKLKSGTDKPLMVVLSYPVRPMDDKKVIYNIHASPGGKNKIRLALVGAGGFAKGMHLPNLQSLSSLYQLRAIVSRTGFNAVATAKQFAANYGTTDYGEVLKDPEIDAVIIATRHDLHAKMALEALCAGKHVLLEKPMALKKSELEEIKSFYSNDNGTKPILLTGFNRRFSPYALAVGSLIQKRISPMMIQYTMNAGHIPLNHWVHLEEGGGRNLGEACHIYDIFTYLTGSKIVSVSAKAIKPSTNYYSGRDNFTVLMNFEDGSVATLAYTALGSREYPKERLEIFFDGKVVVIDDYKRLSASGAKVKALEAKISDKGQKGELVAFAKAIKEGGEWPIPLWQQVQATEISFAVEDQISGGN